MTNVFIPFKMLKIRAVLRVLSKPVRLDSHGLWALTVSYHSDDRREVQTALLLESEEEALAVKTGFAMLGV